jgi:hypothetical protein
MSCPSGSEGAGRKRAPAMGQRAALLPYAIEYLRNGGDIYTLQIMLGHSSLDMVRRYLMIVQADIDSQHKSASPVANWRL